MRRQVVIVPQDEFNLQIMLGVSSIPGDITDEYLRRVRYLHRVTSGGPMGPGMLIDMLRFLGYEPASGEKTPSGDTDWRSVKIGTLVNVRRAGRWSLASTVCRFVGFVDSGTLAVEVAGGRVDEFMRHDVRLATDAVPEELDRESFIKKEDWGNARDESNPLVEILDREPEDTSEPEYDQADSSDTVSVDESEPPEEPGELLEPEAFPEVDWQKVKANTPVYARLAVGDEMELHDATFQRRLKNGKIAIVLKGEEQEMFIQPTDCRLP